MLRALVAFCAAVLLWGGLYALLDALHAGGVPADGLMIGAAATALLLALAAAALSAGAYLRWRKAAADLDRLALSVGEAIAGFSARTDANAATIARLGESLREQLGDIENQLKPVAAQLLDHRTDKEAQNPNVVSLPQGRKGRQQPAAPADLAGTEAALAQAVASGKIEISLQPIIAIAAGAAAGFDVFLHLESERGEPVDLRRLPSPVPGVDPAVFERLLVVAAIEAARRKLGATSETTPLHVAVSEALTGSLAESTAVLDLLRQYPTAARSIVFSLPAPVLEAEAAHPDFAGQLADLGLRFAVEGWQGPVEAAPGLASRGTAFLKLTADRLLDRLRPRKGIPPVSTLLEAAASAGIAVIAQEVRSDEDAVALVDIGVDLMSGERFFGPRRLRPESGSARPGKGPRPQAGSTTGAHG